MSIALVTALWLVGCTTDGPDRSPGEPVQLLTGGLEGCYPGPGPIVEGELLPDSQHGTAIRVESSRSGYSAPLPSKGSVLPVMWPTGFTARWSGGRVEVLNVQGERVAATGGTVRLEAMAPVMVPEDAERIGAFAACAAR